MSLIELVYPEVSVMQQIIKPEINQQTDFSTLITVICHLMTLYAIHPCENLASNINCHLQLLLRQHGSEALLEWQATFQQLHCQWENIERQYRKSNEGQMANTNLIM